MKSIFKQSRVLLILFTIFIFTGCGYKPSSHYAKDTIKGKVFVDVDINVKDPKNSVIVKDSLNEIVVNRLNRQLVNSKSLADTVLIVKLNSVSMTELQKDSAGYVNFYRANVSITVNYSGPGGNGTVTVGGNYDFSVDDGSETISEVKRFESIRIASSKALEEIISKFAIESFRQDDLNN